MQGGRLPGAVRANQAHDLARQYPEGEVLDRGEIAVHLVQTLGLDH
jgi:hypothetical protein